MSKRHKTYTGNLHTQPYDLEGDVFEQLKANPDYDDHDLALLVDQMQVDGTLRRSWDEPEPFTQLDLSNESRKILKGSAEFGTDANDAEDRLSEVGGKPRPAPLTRQLVQDAGGYVTEIDPKLLWKTQTTFYCRACGKWIGSPSKRIECEVPFDPCTSEMLNNRGGCQNCREQRAIDQKEARGTGNPPKACRPRPGEKESRCAKDWRNAISRWEHAVDAAEKRGNEPPPKPQPAEPKLTERDRRKIKEAQMIAQIRAEYETRRPPPVKRQPSGVWDQDPRGTGFAARDYLRKPGWQ